MRKNSLKYKLVSKMASMMMSCDQATYLVSKAREEKLSLKEWMNLKLHLLSCKLCQRYEDEIKALDNYLKKNEAHTCAHHQLDEIQKERIQTLVLKEIK